MSQFKDHLPHSNKNSLKLLKAVNTRNHHRKLQTDTQNPVIASSFSLRNDESLLEGFHESIDSSIFKRSESKHITIQDIENKGTIMHQFLGS